MSLAKWLAKHAPEMGEMAGKAGKWAAANKGPLAAAAAIPAGIGAYEVAQPTIDDFMTDQALKSMVRSGKRAAVDTIDYANEHPYVASALMGAAGLAGGKLGEGDFSDMFNSISPVKVPARRNRR